jgi:hypothetical protein
MAVPACPFPTFPTRVLNRPHKTVDVVTTCGPDALFKKVTKIANVRRSSWANRRAIRMAYWMGLIEKMMLGYGKYAGRDRFQLSRSSSTRQFQKLEKNSSGHTTSSGGGFPPCRSPATPIHRLTPRSERSGASLVLYTRGGRLDGGGRVRAGKPGTVRGRGSRGWPCWLPESRMAGALGKGCHRAVARTHHRRLVGNGK